MIKPTLLFLAAGLETASAQIPAFPGAQGFGAYATGSHSSFLPLAGGPPISQVLPGFLAARWFPALTTLISHTGTLANNTLTISPRRR